MNIMLRRRWEIESNCFELIPLDFTVSTSTIVPVIIFALEERQVSHVSVHIHR